MTVLLVLLFIIAAVSIDSFIQYRRKKRGRQHEFVMRTPGLLPTMADGGQEVKD